MTADDCQDRQPGFSRAFFGRLAGTLLTLAGVFTAVSLALPLPPGQHRGLLAVVSAVALLAGGAVVMAPWDRWPLAVMRWTLVPAALVLIAAGNMVGGLDPFSFGATFALVFAWIGLSQPRWMSLRFVVPAAVAYAAPLLVHDRSGGEVATVAFVVPMCVLIAEGCAFVAERLRQTHADLRTERRLLGLLGAVTAVANEATDPMGAFRQVVDEVCRWTDWPVGLVYARDESGTFRPSGGWHPDDPDQFAALRVTTNGGPAVGVPARVAVSAQAAWVADLDQDAIGDPRWSAAKESGLGASLVFPVVAAGRVAVVFEFFASGRRPVDQALLDLTTHLGAQLGRMLERHRAEEGLRSSEERTRRVIEAAGDPYIGMDDAGIIREWNQRAESTFGWSRAEALGRDLADLIVPEALRPAHRHGLRRFLESGDTTILGRPVQLQAVTRAGRELPIELSVWATRVDDEWAFHAFARDISERARLEAELTRQALHDALTGLPNRTLLLDRLDHALVRSTRAGSPVTVLFLDLDGFKTVNDSLGHDVGDRLLIGAAKQLQKALRPCDTIARLGGDEFAVLLEDSDPSGGVAVAKRLAAALATPVSVEARQLIVQASIGIATGRSGEATAADLLRDADLAMYMAKRQRKGGYVVFESGMHHAAVERLELEADLRQALPAGELLVHYQPVIRFADRGVVSTEALLRWRRGGQELIPPGSFVPIAEETGIIVDIGRWVLQEACLQTRRWQSEHQPSSSLGVAVNVSARQIQDPRVVADVADALEGSGLDPECLVLELTESVLMDDPDRAAATLKDLKDLGLRLAIDDFGTGYSSLGYLRRFPIDILKVDRSFVAGLAAGPEDAAVAHAIIKLGQTLNLVVVAEGIETDQELEELRRLGCEYGQGYLFARPLAPDAVTGLLRCPQQAPVARPLGSPIG